MQARSQPVFLGGGFGASDFFVGRAKNNFWGEAAVYDTNYYAYRTMFVFVRFFGGWGKAQIGGGGAVAPHVPDLTPALTNNLNVTAQL